MESPKAHCTALLSNHLDAALRIPLLPSYTSRSHLTLDLDAVIVLLSDASNNCPAGKIIIHTQRVGVVLVRRAKPVYVWIITVPGCPIPLISISAFREHRRRSLELDVRRATHFSSPHVGIDNKFADVVAHLPVRNIREHFMEEFQLLLSVGLLNDSSVFTETSEIEGLDHGRQNDERRLAAARR